MVIVWIKHITDGLGQVFLLHGLLIITFIEGVQVEGVNRLCIPDPQGIDNIVAIAYDRQVIRNSHNRLITLPERNVLFRSPRQCARNRRI